MKFIARYGRTLLLSAAMVAAAAGAAAGQTDITAEFKDDNFRAEVYKLIGKTAPAEILDSDVSGITEVDVGTKWIRDLSGIKYFTALMRLDCSGNPLTTALDVSKNTALTYLDCSANQLTALDVSENTALTYLDCNYNKLTALDVSKNTALGQLDCGNQIRTNYVFGGWYTDAAYTAQWNNAISSDLTLYAKWAQVFTIRFSVTGSNGTLTAKVNNATALTTGGTVQAGDAVVFTAVPKAGYRVKSWTGVTVEDQHSVTATLENVTKDETVTVEFEEWDKVTGVLIEPQTVKIQKIMDASKREYTFTAEVEGTGEYDQRVSWSISAVHKGFTVPTTDTPNATTIFVDSSAVVGGGVKLYAISVGDPSVKDSVVLDVELSGIFGELAIIGGDAPKVGVALRAEAADVITIPANNGVVTYTWVRGSLGSIDTLKNQTAVEVIDPPITLTSSNAVVILSKPSWTYDGNQQSIGGSDVVVKYLKKNEDKSVDSVQLIEDVDYTLSYTSAVNVGTATLRVTGKEDYAGSLTKTFAIEKKTTEAFDYTLAVDERPYTGSDTLGAVVKLVAPLTNSGSAVTVYYSDGTSKKTAVPINVGVYDVTIDVTAGANMTAGSNLFIGYYTITKGVLDKDCFNYAIPTGHRESDTASAFGIGTVTWKKGTGYGSFTVLYNGDTTVPKAGGIYTVRADVTGGPNFDEGTVILGEYRIARIGDAVADVDREVPSTVANEAASVAPVKAASASFAAGPAPVSKNDVIKFFSAKAVKSGTLYIFDANGNAVAKVSNVSGSGEIGSWNLKDKKGVAAAEGAYVVRGVLIGKDGTREKVSFVFSVAR
ncbi:Internalin-J precursor [Fibrobacteres bacterium R8-0-B4]